MHAPLTPSASPDLEDTGALDRVFLSLPDVWAQHARWRGDRDALVCGQRRISWAALHAQTNRVANGLRARGIGRGDKVAVLMGNGVEIVVAMLGAIKSGACLVPLSTLVAPDALQRMIQDADARCIVVSTVFLPVVEAMRQTLDPAITFVAVGTDAPTPWTAWDDFLGDAADLSVSHRADDEFNLIYSSGTTGTPKGILQSHQVRHHFAYSNAVEMGFDGESRALTSTALYSNGTWLMVMPILFVGGTLVIMERFDVDASLRLLQTERCTHTFMVPSQYQALLNSPALAGADLSALKTALSAGSPLRADTKLQLMNVLGPKLYELWGLSEGCATLLKPADMPHAIESSGRPVLGFDVRIIDEAGRELGPDQLGELVGYGAGMMQRYHRQPQLTRDAIWRDERGRSWIRTGDIGRIDSRGFVYIVDRKKDMIIRGGFNVFSADIESVLAGHPDIADVAVIGIPDAQWGEVPCACTVLKPGLGDRADAIIEWSNGQLGKHQRVAVVWQLDELPRNVLGKVLKQQLRTRHRELHGAGDQSAANASEPADCTKVSQ